MKANRLAFFPVALTLSILAGCGEAQITSNPVLLNTEKTSRNSGGTDDIYQATSEATASLLQSPRLSAQTGRRVVLNQILNKTGIPGYDENIIYNKLLDGLVNSTDKLSFLNRESIARERSLQATGQVKTTGADSTLAGADLILDVELRQLPGAESQTIQYTFRLTNISSELVWTKSIEIKKRI